ncbi:hypothetical protein [Candidatus Entotheonella palauensis]|uniref:hypothetical protein n=1 Tax=Candidatus Entotheonella palauensis TaxID=93172 RepID=UPI0004AD267D|nr:hypothetical protein [Candidatus Entotheonella palauensis]
MPKHTDAFLAPAPDEATIVDEPSPFASSTGHTPIDFTVAPPHAPDTGYDTIELDIGGTQSPETPGDAPVLPDLPQPTDAFIPPSADEATIVDEPSPFASTSHITDATTAPSETIQPDSEMLDEDLELELLFPDEQPPEQRD